VRGGEEAQAPAGPSLYFLNTAGMMMMMRGARTLSSSFRLLRRFGSSSIPAAPSSMGNSFAVDDATLVPCTAHHISRSLDHIRCAS
jgi:hypothetical protein